MTLNLSNIREDSRVLFYNAGTSYDRFETNTAEEAEQVIIDYGLTRKYGPHKIAGRFSTEVV